EIVASINRLYSESLNVGPDQLARAIVFLSDGNFKEFARLRSTFLGDPRDVLLEANKKLVRRNYWFSEPFSEMGPVQPD
ncbi:MAG: hypothetical protein AAF514_15695, partial [Verrucomicrobiota bacterium]